MAHWLDRLAHMPGGPALPLSSISSEERSGVMLYEERQRLRHALSASEWASLKDMSTRVKVSPTVLLLTLFAELLGAFGESRRFSILMTYGARNYAHPQIVDVVGPLISTNIFPIALQQDVGLSDFARQVQRDLLKDTEHAHVTGVQVLRELKARRMLDATTTLPVVFTSLLSTVKTSNEARSDAWKTVHVVNQTPQVLLDFQVYEELGQLVVNWDVAKSYFEHGLIERMFETLCCTLSELGKGGLRWERRELSDYIETLRAEGGGQNDMATLVAHPEDAHEPFVPSDQQQAYLYQRNIDATDGCICYHEFDFEDMDVDRLESAWNLLIDCHPMLRAVVTEDRLLSIQPEGTTYRLARRDLRSYPQDARKDILTLTREEMTARYVPHGEWPAFELRVSRLSDRNYRLHACVDLVIADAPSISILFRQLLDAYFDGITPPRPAATFRDYQEMMQRLRMAPESKVHVEAWRQKFKGYPGGPTFQLRWSTADARHRRLESQLDDWTALKVHARHAGVDPANVLLAAYLEVMSVWNDRRPLAIVVPSWERLPVHPQIVHIIGEFTSMAWVKHDGQPMAFVERVRMVSSELKNDLDRRPISGLSALRRLAIENKQGGQYGVVFTRGIEKPTFQRYRSKFKFGDVVFRTPHVVLDSTSRELTDGRLVCAWDGVCAQAQDTALQSMFDMYLALLSALAQDGAAWHRHEWDCIVA